MKTLRFNKFLVHFQISQYLVIHFFVQASAIRCLSTNASHTQKPFYKQTLAGMMISLIFSKAFHLQKYANFELVPLRDLTVRDKVSAILKDCRLKNARTSAAFVKRKNIFINMTRITVKRHQASNKGFLMLLNPYSNLHVPLRPSLFSAQGFNRLNFNKTERKQFRLRVYFFIRLPWSAKLFQKTPTSYKHLSHHIFYLHRVGRKSSLKISLIHVAWKLICRTWKLSCQNR